MRSASLKTRTSVLSVLFVLILSGLFSCAAAEQLAAPQILYDITSACSPEDGYYLYLQETYLIIYFSGSVSHGEQYGLEIRSGDTQLSPNYGVFDFPDDETTHYCWVTDADTLFPSSGTYEAAIVASADGYETVRTAFHIVVKERAFEAPPVIIQCEASCVGQQVVIEYMPALHYLSVVDTSFIVRKGGETVHTYSYAVSRFGPAHYVIEDTAGWEPGEYTIEITASYEEFQPVSATAEFSILPPPEEPPPEEDPQPYSLNPDGTLTVQNVDYLTGDDIVLPDTAFFEGEERVITAIAPGAMKDNIPRSLRLPAGLKELRGDEITYPGYIDESIKKNFTTLIVPGKDTVVHPAFLERYPNAHGSTIYANKGSTAWFWGLKPGGCTVKTTGQGVTGSLPEQETITSASILNGVLGPSPHPNDDEWYVSYDEGLRVSLPGIKAGGRWLALEWGEINAVYTGSTEEDGVITLRLPVGGETSGRFDGLWLSYNNGDGAGWAQLAGYRHRYEVNGLKVSFSAAARLEQTVLHLPDDMRANDDRWHTVSWDPVPGAERYVIQWHADARGRTRPLEYSYFSQEVPADTCSYDVHSINFRAGRYEFRVLALATDVLSSRTSGILTVLEPEPGRETWYDTTPEGDRILRGWYASGVAEIPENTRLLYQPFEFGGVTELIVNPGVLPQGLENLRWMLSLRKIYLPDELYDAKPGVNTYAKWPQKAGKDGLGIIASEAPDLTFYVDSRDSSAYRYAVKIANQLMAENRERNDRVVVALEDAAGNGYELDQNNTASLTSLSEGALGGDGTLTVPQKITLNGKAYTVTEIGADLLAGNPEVTAVVLPQTITAIGAGAFRGAENLSSITIPASLETIGEGAFEGSALETLDLSKTALTSLGAGAFRGAESLSSVTLPASVETIGAAAFSGCESLADVTMPGNRLGVTNADVFEGLDAGTTVHAPAGSTAAYFAASAGLTVEPTEETLPAGPEPELNTANGMISTRESLTVTVDGMHPEWDYVAAVERLEPGAESGELVRIVTREKGLREITSRAVTDLVIDAGLLPEGDYALRYAFLGSDYRFDGWSSMETVRFTVTNEPVYGANGLFFRLKEDESGWILEGVAQEAQGQTEFDIPRMLLHDGVTKPVLEIADNAFAGIDGAALSLRIPASVVKIGAGAIPAGAGVMTPEYSIAWFCGKAYGWNVTELAVEAAQRPRALILPDGTLSVGANALAGTAARIVILPAGCSVEADAFADCPDLTVLAFRGAPGMLSADMLGSGASAEGLMLVNASQAGAAFWPDALLLDGVVMD